MELDEMLKIIDKNCKSINDSHPLKVEEIRELDEYYRIGSTYTSNALEGNTLTLSETKVLLEDGITVGGKPLKDCFEAIGHAKAYNFMLTAARSKGLVFNEELICRLHFLFYSGIDVEQAGCYRKHQVFITGTDYVPPLPEDVDIMMKEFIDELNEKKDKIHPVLFAAYAHKRLVDIHPYVDGNGRMARLLMNLILINRGYCIVSIPPIWRNNYVSALVEAQRKENPTDDSFYRLIAECEMEAQRDYKRMFRIPVKKEVPRNERGR